MDVRNVEDAKRSSDTNCLLMDRSSCFFCFYFSAKIGRKGRKRVNKTISNKVSRDNVITWYTGLGPPGQQASYLSLCSCFNLTLCCGRYLTFSIHVRGMLLSASALYNIIVLLNTTLNSWICLF